MLRYFLIRLDVHYKIILECCIIDIICKLPNSINSQYTVNLKSENVLYAYIENIIDENGKIIFSGGRYQKDSHLLLGDKEESIFEDNFQVRTSEKNPYNDDYKVPLNSAAGFATYSKDTIRGEYKYLIIAIILCLFTLIDIKFPLLFFTLRHMWEVNDPEPSDFYIAVQGVSWYVVPGIALILMIISIT